jgi:hypothetical protein
VADDYPLVITEFGSTLVDGNFYVDVIEYAEGIYPHHTRTNKFGWSAFFVAPTNPPADARGQAVRDKLWAAKGWTSWGGVPADTTKPAAISNLSASISGSNINLSWTAPGDDGSSGTASFYEVRYGRVPITADNWSYPTSKTPVDQILNVPVPLAAGTSQSATVKELDTGLRWFFAIRTGDDQSTQASLSPISNSAQVNSGIALTSVNYNNDELGGTVVPSSDMDLVEGAGIHAGVDYAKVTSGEYVQNVAAVDADTGYKIRVRASGTNAKIVVKYNGTTYTAWAGNLRKDLLVAGSYDIYETTALSGFSSVNVNPNNLVRVEYSPVILTDPSHMRVDWVEVVQ